MKREPGTGVYDSDFLTGKLSFIDAANNGIRGQLSIKHWPGADASVNGNKTVGTTTSVDVSGNGGTEVDWLISEIQHGEDVELRWNWTDGSGHWVDLVGAGKINGVPWVAYTQDANQGNPGGTSWYDGGIGFTFITDNNLLPTTLAGLSGPAVLDFAVSESVPEPSQTAFLLAGLLALVAARCRARRK